MCSKMCSKEKPKENNNNSELLASEQNYLYLDVLEKNAVLKKFAEDVQEFIDMNLESLEELSRFKKQGKIPESIDNEDELDLRVLDLHHSTEILKIMKIDILHSA